MLFDPNNLRNTPFEIEVIFNIVNTIYIYIYYFIHIKYFSLDFLFLKAFN